MVTTSSTTSTPTPTPSPTPSPSASSVMGSAAQALFNSLSTGSGVDTASLVTSLVQAQFATKTDALTAQSDALTAQISGVSTLKSTIQQFATALKTLTTNGTLQSQPQSSNNNVLTASAQTGAALNGLTASITVSQLAGAQVATTQVAVADRTAVIGSGQLTLTLGSATYSADGSQMTGFTAGAGTPVTIDLTNSSLDGIAAAINAKKAGVTASVVTDVDGKAYLSLKGTTGQAQAFTLAATTDPTGNLAQFNVGVGATGTKMSSVAQNAKLTVDGVSVERASNTVTDLITGVKLQLTGTSPVAVSLTASSPTDALKQAITDFVDSYNEVLNTINTQIDPQNGPLKNDTAARAMLNSLRTLTTRTLLSGAAAGTPTTLGEIGIKTNRDGTLSVDDASVTNALNNYPASVEAMFSFSTSSSDGITAAMNGISLTSTSTLYGLGASLTRYNQQQSDVSKAKSDLSDQSDQMKTRLTQQFASMNAKVAAYKSTQAFLKSQIDAWAKGSN
ncbi:flagellar filament capping protein FliD [Sphingomonas pruni]|uniref:flagellar filament capping protein FliD n=1 Tax=Sphingomonas pruni TaxID=40683 RepID=UPI00082A5DC5|nr:flagellar filament capping protein FliD [Sphingomonas pruni]